jgi:cobalt/nickel transport system permease protein
LLAHGSAFGEDAGSWHHALLHGYDFTHDAHPVVGYIVSALVGMAVIGCVAFAAVSLISRVRSPAR